MRILHLAGQLKFDRPQSKHKRNNRESPKNNFEYWKIGIFHFCVQDPDVEGLAQKIANAGGKYRMKAPRYYYPGEKPY